MYQWVNEVTEWREGWGKKAIPSLVVYCRPPRKMSCHPILMATGVFTSARINIWLQGLMSEWESRAKSLSCNRIWRKEGSKERTKDVDKEMWWHLLADTSSYSHFLHTSGHSVSRKKAQQVDIIRWREMGGKTVGDGDVVYKWIYIVFSESQIINLAQLQSLYESVNYRQFGTQLLQYICEWHQRWRATTTRTSGNNNR